MELRNTVELNADGVALDHVRLESQRMNLLAKIGLCARIEAESTV